MFQNRNGKSLEIKKNNNNHTRRTIMPTIRVLSGGGFNEQVVTATTVSALRTELDIPAGASVNVNGQGINDGNHPIADDDTVAAVSNNKTGGK